jgi:hypothetical protein
VANAQTSVTLKSLGALAKTLRVPAWVLVVPGLDPDDMPVLTTRKKQEDTARAILHHLGLQDFTVAKK